MHGFSGHRLPELAAFVPWLQRAPPRPPVRLPRARRERRKHDHARLARAARRRRRGAVPRGPWPGADRAVRREHGRRDRHRAAPDLPVAAVVADAAFAELHHPIANRMREVGYPLAELGRARSSSPARCCATGSRLRDPLRAVARIAPRPLLLIAPREDALISWRQSLRLFEAAGEPKELRVVDGAGHAKAYAVRPGGLSALACSTSWSVTWATASGTHRCMGAPRGQPV